MIDNSRERIHAVITLLRRWPVMAAYFTVMDSNNDFRFWSTEYALKNVPLSFYFATLCIVLEIVINQNIERNVEFGGRYIQ